MKLTGMQKLKYLMFIAPGFLLWSVFALYPNIQVYYYALLDWNGISKVKTFVGFTNFRYLTYNSNFFKAIYNSLLYVGFYVALSVAVSLTLALLLKRNTRINIFFRAYFFMPLVFSSVTIALIWSYIYDPNIGMINAFFEAIHLPALELNWLGIRGLDMFCIALVSLWAGAGLSITIFLAGLNTIPELLEEAAEVEGAGKLKILTYITLPLMMPTILRVSLLSLIGASMSFDVVYAMSGSGSIVSAPYDTLAVYMYRTLSSGMNVGTPSAIGVILSVVVFLFFMIQFIVTKKIENAIR